MVTAYHFQTTITFEIVFFGILRTATTFLQTDREHIVKFTLRPINIYLYINLEIFSIFKKIAASNINAVSDVWNQNP